MSYHPGGGRGGRGGRGRGRGRGRGGGGGGRGTYGILTPCKDYTLTGTCKRGEGCNFAHIVTLHKTVHAATKPAYQSQAQSSNNNYRNNYNNNNKAQVSSIAIWEQPNPAPPKIFTGSSDGYWRLWNSQHQFAQEFECNMNGNVQVCLVNSNFLFCGFEALSKAVPDVPVGMVHAWNLTQPQQPPLELHVQPAPPPPPAGTAAPPPVPSSLPYAHNSTVTALHMAGTDANVQMASGSKDGSIRLWKFATDKFVLANTLLGHARQVTGLVLLPAQHLLWSCGTDNCIRIWNTATGECQYCINRETVGKDGTPFPQQKVGHTHAITNLICFDSPGAGTFILSSSLDRTVKVWSMTGDCMASQTHNDGVVCMSLAKDTTGTQLLLLGLEGGNVQCRSLEQTPKVPAFELLFTLSQNSGTQHNGAVKTLASGPLATFYSGGADGNMMVYSFTGDLGLK